MWVFPVGHLKCTVTLNLNFDFLTAHNWQILNSGFLTCHRHEIYREEAVGVKSSNYTLKITIFENMCNLGHFR